MKSVAFITGQAFSLRNFRGPVISSLARSGVIVYGLAPDFDDTSRAELVALGGIPVDISFSRVGKNPFLDFFYMIRLFRVLRKIKPDVVISYFLKAVIYGSMAAKLARVPYRYGLIEGLGFVFTESREGDGIGRRLLRVGVKVLLWVAMRCLDKVIFLNRDDLSEFVNGKIVSPNRTELLGGIGVDLQEWEYYPPVVDPVIFVLVARMLREKGVIEFCEAAHKVKAKRPGARFWLLGGLDENPGGISERELRRWTESGVIDWYGHVSVKAYLVRSSVFVLPSYREGVPRSSQEAMAMGRAVITTDVPGCRETVKDGVNGFLIPPRDSDALADRMIRFIDERNLIVQMGNESRSFAEDKFDVVKINSRLMKIINLQLEAPL